MQIVLLLAPFGCSNPELPPVSHEHPPTTPPSIIPPPGNKPKSKLYCAREQANEIITCLKKQIATHKPEPLMYKDLISMLEEQYVTEQEAIDLVKYGYDEMIGNPILFLRAREEIKANQYSINLLWIHKDSLNTPGHLMGSNDPLFTRHVINPLKDWQSKQPDANLNFWYDGNAVKATNIAETEKLLKSSGLDLKTIRLKDIRTIPYVAVNPDLFDRKLPVYFRVDLAKAVIADYVLREQGLPFVVNADSDIAAVVRSQLFDDPTLVALKSIGYSFGTARMAEEENSFIILHNSNDLATLKVHRDVVIDVPAQKTRSKSYSDKEQEQAIFLQYSTFKRDMSKAFRNKTGKGWATQNIQKTGKFMIFPKSQFGFASAYTDDEIQSLKPALISATEQAKAFIAR